MGKKNKTVKKKNRQNSNMKEKKPPNVAAEMLRTAGDDATKPTKTAANATPAPKPAKSEASKATAQRHYNEAQKREANRQDKINTRITTESDAEAKNVEVLSEHIKFDTMLPKEQEYVARKLAVDAAESIEVKVNNCV